MSQSATAEYFDNHRRRTRFPWSLYHEDLARRVARAVRDHGDQPRVLVVGCGLEPIIEGGPPEAGYFGCDLDARAIEECQRLYPKLAGRLGVCPSAYQLPASAPFDEPFDVVVAKEVVEHVEEPARWASSLARAVATGGELVLTTPNYGRLSTLALLENTVLEWIARRDGYSRRHIHPSKFTKSRLTQLDVGPGMQLVSIERTFTNWALVGRWRRVKAG